MRIYLSGAMSGVPDLNFPAFHEAAAKLRSQGSEVFNPAEMGTDLSYAEYLKKDLEVICTWADTIALLPGWKDSPGAFAEWAVAKALGRKVIEL